MNYNQLLKLKNINYLTHFTNIENLKSILTNGILSVDYMNKNNIKYTFSDNNRFDNQLNLISLSLNKINNKMLYKKIKQNQNKLNIWIVLILDNTLLDDSNLKCYFCDKNAASTEINTILKKDKNILSNIDSLNSMIESKDSQKEILIEGKISAEYIKKIVVKDMNDYDLVKYILKENNQNIEVVYNKEIFSNY